MPRVRHPDWLHKSLLQKSDKFKQRSISDMFAACPKPAPRSVDIEDAAGSLATASTSAPVVAKVTKRKRNTAEEEFEDVDMNLGWREVLGAPPPFGKNRARTHPSQKVTCLLLSLFAQEENLEWIRYQKKKWRYQLLQRSMLTNDRAKRQKGSGGNVVRPSVSGSLGGFLMKAEMMLLRTPWQVLQIVQTSTPGEFKLWALVSKREQREGVD